MGIYISGPGGTGKSHFAEALARSNGGAYFLTQPATGQPVWFDGYKPGQSIVIDEFRGGIPYHFLLRLIDKFPMIVQIKGGCIHVNPPAVIITSNITTE